MAGNKRIVNGRIAQGKLRGRALSDALARNLNNEENTGTSKKQHS